MIFLTMDGEHIDISKARRIFVGRRPEEERWVIVVEIGEVEHPLVSTGDNLRQAIFHCIAINQCQLNRTVTREEVYGD